MRVLVCLRRVLGLEVLVGVMRVAIRRVAVLVMVPEAEMLESPGVLEEVVREVIMLVGVRHGLVRVLVARPL
jgi:hypothetical protein